MQELLTFAVLEEARIILSTAVWTFEAFADSRAKGNLARSALGSAWWESRAEQNVLAMSARQKAKEGSKKKHLILKLILHA